MDKAEQLRLVSLAQGGDKDAFRILYEEYYSRCYALAYRIMKNADDAEEVVQESFVKAYLALNKFKGDSSFYTWLYQIVRNMAIDVHRKLKRRATKAVEEEELVRVANSSQHLSQSFSNDARSADLVLEQKEDLSLLQRALATLKSEQREILVLREMEGFSYDEIANLIGINSGTVMSRLFYARKALQKALAG